MNMKYVSTNLINDEKLNGHADHKLNLFIDGERNGNFTLECKTCNETLCEFQNNDITEYEEDMDKEIEIVFKTLKIGGDISPLENKENFWKRKLLEVHDKLVIEYNEVN